MTTATKTSRPYAVRSSKIHGRGVFATRAIPKGSRIVEYRGKRTAWEDAIEQPASDPDNPNHTFFFSLDDGRVIDAGQGGNAARWINHSCAPNCKPREEDGARIYIYAKRDIAAGEELGYDYRLNIEGKVTKRDRKDFACHCGAPKCRGTMLDPDLLKKKRKKKKRKNKKKG